MSRRSPLRLAAAAALLLAPALAPLTIAAAPASAALPAGCTQASPGADVVCTYTATGEHAFVVPAGVTSVRVTAVGARGGSSNTGSDGGRGARVTATLAVTVNATLYAEVGGVGGTAGAGIAPYNGGGAARNGARSGGGASDVRTKPAADAMTLGSRRLVAGGGGAAGRSGTGSAAGGDAGAPGQSDPASSCSGGQPGADTGPGAGGTCTAGDSAQGSPGALGQGGNEDGDGGAGGGGYYGGGSGGTDGANLAASGGGGGSSYIEPAATNTSGPTLTTDPPSVTISYTPVPTALAVTAAPSSVQVGDAVTASATKSSADEAAYPDATDGTTFTITPDGSCDKNVCRAAAPGEHTITGVNGTLTGKTTVQVDAADLTVTPADSTLVAGEARTFKATDENGTDVTAATTFTIAPDGSCDGATCTATKAGEHTVTATPTVQPPSNRVAPRGVVATLTAAAALAAAPAAPAAARNGQATVTVVHAAATKLALDPATASIPARDSQRYAATGTDRFGNDFDATSSTAFAIDAGGSCTRAVCSPVTAGKHTVTATSGTGADALTATATLTGTTTAAASADDSGSDTSDSNGVLPGTGTSAGILALALTGLALVTVGGVLMATRLRRRTGTV